MGYLYDACDQISDFCHQQLQRKMRRKISWTDGRTEVKGKHFWTHQIPTSCFPTLLIFLHIEHICSFFVAFLSATIDGRNLIFGHKLHIGTPYRGKRFLTRHCHNQKVLNYLEMKYVPILSTHRSNICYVEHRKSLNFNTTHFYFLLTFTVSTPNAKNSLFHSL
jgi:hypothetical protein